MRVAQPQHAFDVKRSSQVLAGSRRRREIDGERVRGATLVTVIAAAAWTPSFDTEVAQTIEGLLCPYPAILTNAQKQSVLADGPARL
jgi:hypothetical protein